MVVSEAVVEGERKRVICNYIRLIRDLPKDDVYRKRLADIVKCFDIPGVELDESTLHDMVLSVLARKILRVLGVDEGGLYNVDIDEDGNTLHMQGMSYYYWVEAEPDPDVCERVTIDRFLIA